jgi:hypothetical protein
MVVLGDGYGTVGAGWGVRAQVVVVEAVGSELGAVTSDVVEVICEDCCKERRKADDQ